MISERLLSNIVLLSRGLAALEACCALCERCPPAMQGSSGQRGSHLFFASREGFDARLRENLRTRRLPPSIGSGVRWGRNQTSLFEVAGDRPGASSCAEHGVLGDALSAWTLTGSGTDLGTDAGRSRLVLAGGG